GTAELLATRVSDARPDLAAARFQTLQHNALGQTPIALPVGASVGWWEAAGNTRTGNAAAQLGNVVVELRVTGVNPTAPVSDDDVAGWLSTMVSRVNAAPDVAPLDWNQLLAGQPTPWQFVLDATSVGGDWDPQTGLQLSSNE